MKTSLKKLRGFAAVHKNDAKARNDRHLPLPQLDELAQASEDMQDMRNCYDSLLSAAAATANSAYEFSESLHELGACLLEKTALNDDEESGKVLLMLGKLQFELQRLVDSYRSHIFQTITSPSESLLNELRTVEEMKRQCDEKRRVYEYMLNTQKDKGRSRTGKGDTFTSQQLREAHDDYDEEATLFIFRLKSLKQGQSRSLLTQAARHHAAQLHFFKNAVKSLETVDPHVKYVTEQQHIDYKFAELEENAAEDEYDDNDDDSYGTRDDGELSFDCGQNEDNQHAASDSRNSMELDQVDITFPATSDVDALKDTTDRKKLDSFGLIGEMKRNSQSAPLFSEKKRDSSELLRKLQPSSTRKLHTYALPTPDDTRSSVSTKSGNLTLPVRQLSLTRRTNNTWHSSPLEPSNYEINSGGEKSSRQSVHTPQSVVKESNQNMGNTHLPPPLAHGLRFPQMDPYSTSDSKKIKRQSFSGPLTSKESLAKPVSQDHLHMFSGPLLRNPLPSASSPKVSPTRTPSLSSSLVISELHELPRPPVSYTSSYSRSSVLVGHSAPLGSRGQESFAVKKMGTSSTASPLPIPPRSISRSFSIPSNSETAPIPKLLQSPSEIPMSRGSPLHPVTPISEYDDIQTGQSVHQENLSKGAERIDS